MRMGAYSSLLLLQLCVARVTHLAVVRHRLFGFWVCVWASEGCNLLHFARDCEATSVW